MCLKEALDKHMFGAYLPWLMKDGQHINITWIWKTSGKCPHVLGYLIAAH